MELQLYIAKTLAGLEPVLADELKYLGASEIKPGNRMVEFRANKRKLYEINYRVYTALRILQSFATFKFNDVHEFYERMRELPWKNISGPDNTIAIDATVFNCNAFNNSHFTEMKAKDAIADYFRDLTDRRPSVDLKNPELLINIFIQRDFCHVSIDTSGTSLYKRGYRAMLHDASLNEVLAAGLIRLSGWNGEGDFYDPMCGGATIAIEAAMYASGMPSGFYRKHWGFMNRKEFDADLWNAVKNEFDNQRSNKYFTIYASDSAASSIHVARKNIASARMMKIIRLEQKAFESVYPVHDKGILIFNPPYNVRLDVEELIPFYQQIGNHLKHHFKGHEAWIISSDAQAIKHIGLKPKKKYSLMNGPLEAKFHGFAMY